jgi:uncharacterized membrane protein
MSTINVSETAVLERPAETLFTILSDYRNHHPNILPAEFFDGLDVMEGGVGAGTRILVHARAFGSKQTAEMVVSEPEPGSVLAETDVKTGTMTTFSVRPLDEAHTEVTISTAWAVSPGLRGAAERLLLPRYLRNMFQAELKKLAVYAASVTL